MADKKRRGRLGGVRRRVDLMRGGLTLAACLALGLAVWLFSGLWQTRADVAECNDPEVREQVTQLLNDDPDRETEVAFRIVGTMQLGTESRERVVQSRDCGAQVEGLDRQVAFTAYTIRRNEDGLGYSLHVVDYPNAVARRRS